MAILGHAHPAVTRAIARAGGAPGARLQPVPRPGPGACWGSASPPPRRAERSSSATAGRRRTRRRSSWPASGPSIAAAGEGRTRSSCSEGSFHGRTYGGLSATAQPKYHEGFEPMLPGFATVPFGDIAALDGARRTGVCAFLVEPIQGESGVRMHPPGLPRGGGGPLPRKGGPPRRRRDPDGARPHRERSSRSTVRRDARHRDARQGAGQRPASGGRGGARGGGRRPSARARHGSTFGGNPVCCAAALAVWTSSNPTGFMDEVAGRGSGSGRDFGRSPHAGPTSGRCGAWGSCSASR